MNKPTWIGDSGAENVVWSSVERFKGSETDGVVGQNTDRINVAAGKLDQSTNPQIEVQLNLISPLRTNDGEITDHKEANDIAERSLLKLHDHFSGSFKRNIVQDPDDPNKRCWIANFIDKGNVLQLFIEEIHSPVLSEGQKEQFGFSAKAFLCFEGTPEARKRRTLIFDGRSRAGLNKAKRNRPAFGTRGRDK